MSSLDFSDILKARQHLHAIVRQIPFERSAVLSRHTNMDVFLKTECLQRTGSFKLRGAYHKIASLSSEEKTRGIVTSSAGNHAQGIGFAVARFGIPSRIYIPKTIPHNKLEAIQRYRVEVVIEGKRYNAAHAAALADAKKSGRVFILVDAD